MKVDLDWVYGELKKVVENAYAPFSKFRVACMIISDNKPFYGVNTENPAFPVSLCAERSAIGTMITSGQRKIDYVFVYFDTKTPTNSPCGMCRQMIFEFAHDNTKVFCLDPDKTYKIFPIHDLLVGGFKSIYDKP